MQTIWLLCENGLKAEGKSSILPLDVHITVDRNLCFARSCSVFGIGRDVCCTSLRGAERVVYQLCRRLLIMVIFKKLRWTILSSGKECFTILNERFVSNRTGDTIFSMRSSERFWNKHFASDLLMRAKLGGVTKLRIGVCGTSGTCGTYFFCQKSHKIKNINK